MGRGHLFRYQPSVFDITLYFRFPSHGTTITTHYVIVSIRSLVAIIHLYNDKGKISTLLTLYFWISKGVLVCHHSPLRTST